MPALAGAAEVLVSIGIGKLQVYKTGNCADLKIMLIIWPQEENIAWFVGIRDLVDGVGSSPLFYINKLIVVVPVGGMKPFGYLEVGDQQRLVLVVAFHVGKVQKCSGILPKRRPASLQLWVVNQMIVSVEFKHNTKGIPWTEESF